VGTSEAVCDFFRSLFSRAAYEIAIPGLATEARFSAFPILMC
jgi:hypothetical protein